MGFNYVYDKTLYDRLRLSSPIDIRNYLTTSTLPLEKAMHFIENHDEPRASTALGRERSLAAAIVIATIPGMHLFHDGQLEGKRMHLPVQLVREPKEATDNEVSRFYDRLLAICNAPVFHEGKWKLLETNQAWQGNDSYQNLLTWCWYYSGRLKIVAINYASHQSQGRLILPIQLKDSERVRYRDELTGEEYEGNPAEINGQGLYVDLAPWNSHILDMVID
jgi:hypothetical protein